MANTLKMTDIVPNENNYRAKMDKAALQELAASIREKGVLQPIIVRPVKGNDHYEIVAGHRRFAAAGIAGLEEIPVVIGEFEDDEALEVAVTENSQREDANPMDEAHGFKRLMDGGAEVADIAAKIGRPEAYVTGRVRLLDLVKDAQKALASGKISLGHAQTLLRLRHKSEQKQMLDEMVEGTGMTVAEARQDIRRYSRLLTEALFDTTACESCAYRSGSQVALFPELKGTDECSDPGCYFTKTLQHYERLAKEKEDEGFKVLRSRDEFQPHLTTSTRIVPSKREADYRTTFPPKYKSMCTKCEEHHAYFVFSEERHGNRHIEAGELCLNPSCLKAMLSPKGSKPTTGDAPATETQQDEKAITNRRRTKAVEFKDRWLRAMMPSAVEASEVMHKRLALSYLLNQNRDFKGRKEIMDTLGVSEGYASHATIYAAISERTVAMVDMFIKRTLVAMTESTSTSVLLRMMPESGLTLEGDVVIDEEYLKSLQKADLLALIEELGLDVAAKETSKKSEIITAILAQDLSGKATAAMVDAFSVSPCELESEDEQECAQCGWMNDPEFPDEDRTFSGGLCSECLGTEPLNLCEHCTFDPSGCNANEDQQQVDPDTEAVTFCSVFVRDESTDEAPEPVVPEVVDEAVEEEPVEA